MYKFESKKIALIATSTAIAFSTIGCNYSKYFSDDSVKDSVTVTDDVNSQIVESMTTTTLNDTETTNTSENPLFPTDYVDGVGEIESHEYKRINANQFLDLYETRWVNDFFGLGADNPYILQEAQKYFGNKNLTISDLGYLQPEDFDGNEKTGTVNDKYIDLLYSGYFMNFVRYILSQNGLRVMIDEIPYSFFEQNFSDILELYNQGIYPRDYFTNQNPYGLDCFLALLNCDESVLLSMLSIDDPQAKEAVRFVIFQSLIMYNSDRYIIATLDSSEVGFVPIEKSVDGKNVLAPTRYRFSQIQSLVNNLPNCQNVDISTAESYEDLVNSGVNTELVESMIQYADLDIPSLSQGENTETEDQQRTRGTTTP